MPANSEGNESVLDSDAFNKQGMTSLDAHISHRKSDTPAWPRAASPIGDRDNDAGRGTPSKPDKPAGEVRLPGEGLSRHHSPFISAFAGVLYATTSVSMTFFNKAVMNGYNFKYSNTMMLFQMFFTVVFLQLLKTLRLIAFPKFQTNTAKKMIAVTVCYCLNVGFALAALRDLNVPMYNVLKRLTTLTVMVNESWILGKKTSPKVRLAVFIIVAGALLAGATDLDFDLLSYSLAIGSCCVQALYLVCLAKAGVDADLNSFGLLYYNSIMSIPILLAVLLATGELPHAYAFPQWDDFGFQAIFFLSMVIGSLLNYALFFCTQVNSALTTTIVGQFKQIASTGLGYFFFGSKKLSFLNIIGVLINSCGGCYYAYVKMKEKKEKSGPVLPTKNHG